MFILEMLHIPESRHKKITDFTPSLSSTIVSLGPRNQLFSYGLTRSISF